MFESKWRPLYNLIGMLIQCSQMLNLIMCFCLQVRGTCLIVALMGISWVLGYLAERDKTLYFQPYIYEYAFFGANTLLGIFIFLFYCLMRKDACSAWRGVCCNTKRRRVAGKNTLGATTMKSEGSDYTLVVDRKLSVRHIGEEEKMLEPDLSSYRISRDLGYMRSGPSRTMVDLANSRQPRQYRAVDTDSCPASPSMSGRSQSHYHVDPQRPSCTDLHSQHRNRHHDHNDAQNVELSSRSMAGMGWITHHSRI